MRTRGQREADFRTELTALLEKYNAELGADGNLIDVTMMSEWDEDDNQVGEFCEFWI